MAKIVKYDAEGNEVYFDYPVDAREAVTSGNYFDENPVSVKKEEKVVEEQTPKKGRKSKEDEKEEKVVEEEKEAEE